MNNDTKRYLKFLITPVAILLLGIVIGRSCFIFLRNWAWIPVVLTYWIAIGLVLYLDYKKKGTTPVYSCTKIDDEPQIAGVL
ncbi:MAG TPA: hypothetical protein PLG03_01270 [Bacteroidales bacterium]|nr:hypothetical protein [Bacteroidales bacterium]HRR49210.1 hypothetical protein [Bacteroidales bacterium]HRT32945.1 hypothetical protein [Bacteroidales bacterium]HRT83293.1 hypothetical protein [Bacteroidales bacterium]